MKSITSVLILAALVVNGCEQNQPTQPVSTAPTPVPAAPTGQLSFWEDASAAGHGNLAVYVDGVTVGSLSASFSAAPGCAQTGTVTTEVKVGQHNCRVSSADGQVSWQQTVTAVEGCQPVEVSASVAPPPPPPSATGEVSFWEDANDNGHGNVNVFVDGRSAGTLTSWFASQPSCGQQGTLTVTLSQGQHSVSASTQDNQIQWNDTITVAAGCQTWELRGLAPPAGAQLSIWGDPTTNGHGYIAIYVDGNYFGALSSYFSSVPACGQQGTATGPVAPGQHTYTAASQDGLVHWNGVVTVAPGCNLFRFYVVNSQAQAEPPQREQDFPAEPIAVAGRLLAAAATGGPSTISATGGPSAVAARPQRER